MTVPVPVAPACTSCKRAVAPASAYTRRDEDLARAELRGWICSACARSAGFQPYEYPVEKAHELQAIAYRHGLVSVEPTALERERLFKLFVTVTIGRRRGRLVRRYATAKARLSAAVWAERHVRGNLLLLGWTPAVAAAGIHEKPKGGA